MDTLNTGNEVEEVRGVHALLREGGNGGQRRGVCWSRDMLGGLNILRRGWRDNGRWRNKVLMHMRHVACVSGQDRRIAWSMTLGWALKVSVQSLAETRCNVNT